ncbi:GntR family transcriptional regulator [Piscinibacter gummiphilus]|uniref:GntR family transcriptional regulator n=1 Tax=Piscinibacter gummiphilus TaxID=946333 RepID=A0ABZ0CU39_9BURK|nr:GntR family transcriptional regulator [Piscinibacter gummiphilus]WOB08464.1 GntR family transcriptional regulator [Piscinibacter gummiphilus]
MGKADPASTKPLTLVGAPAGSHPPRVSLASSLPLYTQIKEILRARILDGSYQPHQQMPSESEMMATFNVSRITVRQALNDLQNEGLIFRLHGKGTFVSKPKAFQDLGRLQGFGEAMRQMGYETFARVLSVKTVTPSAQVAEKLQLPKRAKVTELQRVRFLNREPISLDVTYVPTSIGQRLAKEDLAARDVFVILENDYGLSLGHAELQIGSTLADEPLATQLKVEEGSPVLFIERTTHTADGAPIDYEHLYYRGDAFQYKVRVDRVPLTERAT